MSVNGVLAHRRVCFVEKYSCIFGCGEILKGKAEHLRHAIEDCPQVDTICQNCGGHSLRENQHTHNCLPNLIKLVDKDKPETYKVALGAAVTQVFEEFKTVGDQN